MLSPGRNDTLHVLQNGTHFDVKQNPLPAAQPVLERDCTIIQVQESEVHTFNYGS